MPDGVEADAGPTEASATAKRTGSKRRIVDQGWSPAASQIRRLRARFTRTVTEHAVSESVGNSRSFGIPPMNTPRLVLLVAAVVLLAGCESRSISDSGYDHGSRYGYGHDRSGYDGELSEFDVVGVNRSDAITDAEIASALQNKTSVRLDRTSRVLLIQSGANFPDHQMQEDLQTSFAIAPFSGRPPHEDAKVSYAKTLRLAAARGGYDKILCYWGVLESEQHAKATKGVSWVPIVGYVIPDQSESMRIRLKAVLIDTATGNWAMIQPEPINDRQASAVLTRAKNDQELVERLKDAGYQSLANLIRSAYTG